MASGMEQAPSPKPSNSQRDGSFTRSNMRWKIFGGIMSATFVVIASLILCLVLLNSSSKTEAVATTVPPLVVDTPSGRYQGVLTPGFLDGTSFVAYKGIPFAKPPVGPLRFKRPQPPTTTSRDQFANSGDYKKSCWSITKTSSSKYYGEDCLYLNVYAPGDGLGANSVQELPVMVWIHGGGFVAGSTFPEPSKMVTSGNVIVVSVNYRMGVYGFLTTEDDELPGNNGLWDVHMALKWIKENIGYFKGDDSRITVFGESSGAISTALLALSPVSSSQFNKVILQSGAATSLIQRDAVSRAHEFASKVGCSGSLGSSSALAECLRGVSIDDIQQNSKPESFDMTAAQKQADFIWMPVIDGELIPDEPLALLNNRSYLKSVGAFDKDYLIGVLNGEGSLVPYHFLNPIPLSSISTPDFLKNLTEYLVCNNRYGCNKGTSEDQVYKAVFNFYTGSSSLQPPLQSQSTLDIAADLIFGIPAIEMAMSISSCSNFQDSLPVCDKDQGNDFDDGDCPPSNAKTYFYYFNYCPATDPCAPPCMNHGLDVSLSLPRAPITDPTLRQLSDTFIDVLTEFAKSSNPGAVVESGWPTFNPVNQNYLNLDLKPSVRSFPYNYRTKFWLTEIPKLMSV